MLKIYIVAGEPSGDLLASGLMRALRRLDPDVQFCGVGGEAATAAANYSANGAVDTPEIAKFKSLFDISEISVMGVFEVLPRLPLILRRIRQTVKDIERFEPDVLVTVDSWGFVSSLLGKLRKKWRHGARQVPVVHYVAPQVWAWKKGRARNVARLVDRLMTLMPDEGRWFEPHGLQCDFVGHPVVERTADVSVDGAVFRAENRIPASATVISVLPGSRHSEVRRLLPILREAVEQVAVERVATERVVAEHVAVEHEAVERLAEKRDDIFVVVPTVPGVEEETRRGFENFSLPVRVVTGEVNRYNAFAVSSLALAKSGTVSLELAALKVPHLIAYKFGRWGNWLARRLVKVRFANLINLLADKEIIPEFVLGNCRSELISECALELLQSPESAERQILEAGEVMQKLRLPDVLPSDRAAQIVLEVAARGNS